MRLIVGKEYIVEKGFQDFHEGDVFLVTADRGNLYDIVFDHGDNDTIPQGFLDSIEISEVVENGPSMQLQKSEMIEKERECLFKEILERANNMPQPPLRYVHFLEDVSIEVALLEDSPIVFEKGEFIFVSECYGYPAGAMIVKNEIAFYLNEIDGKGTKFKVFVEEPSEIEEAV